MTPIAWTESHAYNLYDLKGVGGGSLVVAAGSVRADGEVYAVLQDEPVMPIPDWLVDWLGQDIHKYKSDLAKARAEKAARIKEAQLDATRTGITVMKYDVSLYRSGVDSAGGQWVGRDEVPSSLLWNSDVSLFTAVVQGVTE